MPRSIINVERYAQLPSESERERVIATHERIREVIESSSETEDMSVGTVLQGSYANHTNTPRTSDVDIIVKLDGVWYEESVSADPADWSRLSREQAAQREHSRLRTQVSAALRPCFRDEVEERSKVIHVRATPSGSRRPADVLPVIGYRLRASTGAVHEGVCFWPRFGTAPVSNFPEQHKVALTQKGRPERAGSNFKGIVRAIKSVRNDLLERYVLHSSIAPSYWIEGLLTNVPDEQFHGTWEDALHEVLQWLRRALDIWRPSHQGFLQANGIRPLFGPGAWNDTSARILIDRVFERAFVKP